MTVIDPIVPQSNNPSATSSAPTRKYSLPKAQATPRGPKYNIESGDVLNKSNTIGHFKKNITSNIDNYLMIQNRTCTSIFPVLSPIAYIFDDVDYKAPTLVDIPEKLIIADQIKALFIDHMAKYARARRLDYTNYFHVTKWGTAGNFNSYAVDRYSVPALMSDTSTKFSGIFEKSPPRYGDIVSTQPPYPCLSNDLHIEAITEAPFNIAKGKVITISSYNKFFSDIYTNWKTMISKNQVNLVSVTCHNSCHSDCHKDRSRR